MSETTAIARLNEQPVWLPVKEAAELLGTSKRTVQRNRGQFITTETRANGGTSYLLLLSSLPAAAQEKYSQAIEPTKADGAEGTSSLPTPSDSPIPDGARGQAPAAPSGTSVCGRGDRSLPARPSSSAIPEKLKAIALARVDLVTAWRKFRRDFAKPRRCLKADEEFQSLYNSRLPYPLIFQHLGEVDVTTIRRWHRELEGTSDWTLLVPEWNCEAGEPSLTLPELRVFQNIYLNPKKPTIGDATKTTKNLLKVKKIESSSSDRTFRRWAEWFKANHYDVWLVLREGFKALEDKALPSITRDYSKIEVGDIFVADGHRIDFQVINPFTGKACRATMVAYLDMKSWKLVGYELMVEENTQCVGSALRNSIIIFGKKPKICMQDNGSAFKNKYFCEETNFEESGFQGLFGRLDIIPIFTQPYNAKAKPIERFWKEFIGKFERLMPSFTGSSVDDKPAYTKMGEKWHKAMHTGWVPTIEEAKQLIDWAIENFYDQDECPHVKGKTIGQVFEEGRGAGVDQDALDELMMATETREIRGSKIHFLGADYCDDNLYGLREKAFIKYSLFNLSYIKVYDRAGHFLCMAHRENSTHPSAYHLGNVKDIAELNHKMSRRSALRRSTQRAIKELGAANVEALPWPEIVEAFPQLPEKLEQAGIDSIGAAYEPRQIPEGAYRLPDDRPSEKAPENNPEGEASLQRPEFGLRTIDKYHWLMAHKDQWTHDDFEWLEWFRETGTYRMVVELEKEGRAVTVEQNKHPVAADTIHGV